MRRQCVERRRVGGIGRVGAGQSRQRGTMFAPRRYPFMTEDAQFPRKPLTPEQRQARDAARRVEAEKAMREHEQKQKAFYANKDRLRAERLAREAAAAKE